MPENNRRFAPLAKSVVIEYVEITGSVPRNATIITKSSIPTGSNIDPTEEFIKITSTNKVYRLVAKKPSVFDATNKPNGLKLGEVAVNFKQDFEALFISNNSDGILKFTPIKENIDLYETSQRAATAMAVNEFVLPVEKTYTPSTTLSYTVNENEVYFPSSSTGIATLNLTVNAYNSNQDFVRPATFYFKTSSNGCTVNLLGAALDSVYGVADPSNISLIGNSTYRIIIKDKRAFIECAIPDLSRIEHGEGIVFRNAADTQDKTTLAEAGLIKIKPATTTDKGGVKVYGSSNTNVTATTRPTSPKTNRTYGLEIGNDDKAYVYVPWEKIKEINYTGTENGNTLISAELSSQDADGNVSLNIGRANRLVTVNSATGNGNTVTAVGEDSNHNVTVTTANRLVSVNNATGDGNAVTAIGEDSNHNITVTKGTTFVNTVREIGTGIVLTSIQQNGAIVTATKSKLSYNSLEDKPTIGEGKFKIQSNSSTAVNTNFTANSTNDTVGVKFVNGGNITVTAAASTSTTPATITMGVASGYSIPSDAKQSEWDAKVDTDTKNTAGTMNTNDKIYIVGSKTKATTTENDNKQTNTNGECFIGTDHCLYSDNEKVAIQKDVNEINDLLEILEQWPTITHTVNIKSGATTPTVTISSLPELTSKFTAQQNGAVSSIQITSNNQAVKAGSTVKSVTSIAVTDSATFTPSENSITIIGKTTLSGFTNGYRTTISGDITQSQSYTTSGTGTAQITKINKSKTADSTLTLAYNNVNVTSVNNASASTNITIPTNLTVTSNLGKGLNTIKLTYHNPSGISRGNAEYTIPGISLYNVSSLNRSNNTHLEIEAANSDGCPGVSASASDKTVTLNVYGVFPIFSTTGKNIITNEATAKSTYNTGSTIDVNTNKNYFFNYYTTSSIVLYFLFGSIPNGSANSNAKIFLPVNTDTDYNLRITEIKGFNAVAQNWTVPMTLTGPTEVSGIDGRTYKQYILSDSASAGQGPNAYRVTISR